MEVLSACFLVRHYGCEPPFLPVAIESLEEVDRVYGDYDIVKYTKMWIRTGQPVPKIYHKFLELFGEEYVPCLH